MDIRGLKELRGYYRTLSDATRLRILEQLARRELTVNEIARSLRMSQPLVSWHLHRLKQTGLIRMHRAGREVHCSLDHARLHDYERQFQSLIAG
ncbi:MAG: winged helix-turn-helix transcriptional regulator [Chloroflexi bacterium]|nr:winged helix-turn-helix transcriptional regulator [Chloroflexota bacterium]